MHILLIFSLIFSSNNIKISKDGGNPNITKKDNSPGILISKKGVMEKHPKAFVAGAFITAPILTTLLGMQMWEWGDSTHFKAHSDGWFTRNQSHGGADKTGHMWTFYFGTKIWAEYFKQIYPNEPFKATLLGAGISSLGGIAVEIGDGFASNFGFSYPDLIADALGVAFAVAQARWPWFDNLFDFSVAYLPTAGFLSKYNKNKTDLFTDYSGQIISLNVRLGGIPYIKETLLRYFRVDLGYFTRCYQPYEACSFERTGTNKYETRNLYVGLSFDLARMIEDHGSKGAFSSFLHATSRVYNYWGLMPVGFNIDLNHSGKLNFGGNISRP